jgi:hypothetical protein
MSQSSYSAQSNTRHNPRCDWSPWESRTESHGSVPLHTGGGSMQAVRCRGVEREIYPCGVLTSGCNTTSRRVTIFGWRDNSCSKAISRTASLLKPCTSTTETRETERHKKKGKHVSLTPPLRFASPHIGAACLRGFPWHWENMAGPQPRAGSHDSTSLTSPGRGFFGCLIARYVTLIGFCSHLTCTGAHTQINWSSSVWD